MTDPLIPPGFVTGFLTCACAVLVARWFAWMARERTMRAELDELSGRVGKIEKELKG